MVVTTRRPYQPIREGQRTERRLIVDYLRHQARAGDQPAAVSRTTFLNQLATDRHDEEGGA